MEKVSKKMSSEKYCSRRSNVLRFYLKLSYRFVRTRTLFEIVMKDTTIKPDLIQNVQPHYFLLFVFNILAWSKIQIELEYR